jgi:predicted RNA-binding protein with PIN domain
MSLVEQHAEQHAVFGASTNQKSAEELIKEVGIRELRGQACCHGHSPFHVEG